VLASKRGGPCSIPGPDKSVSGPLVEDGDDHGQVSATLNYVHISKGSPHQQDPGGWKHSFQVGEYLQDFLNTYL
jgi:hypothetical protein